MIYFAGLFLYVNVSYAATIYADDCSLASAQAAYTAASDGDTIVIPAGNCTWSTPLNIRKPLSIIGAGSESSGTKLTAGSTSPYGFFNISGFYSTSLTRISGFYFEMKDWIPQAAIKVNNVNSDNIRIDNNKFNYGNKAILFYNPKGLIDNNYFYNSNLTIEYSAGSDANANASWDSIIPGTEDALFIEDNHFIADNNLPKRRNECIGTFHGGKLVARNNHWDSTAYTIGNNTEYPFVTHGNAIYPGYYGNRGYRRGQSIVEIYNNTIEGHRIDNAFICRGSSNLIYNNMVKTNYGRCNIVQLIEEEYYASTQFNPLRTEWPAEDQIHNTFIWNNTVNGKAALTVGIQAGPGNFGIKENRDFFMHAPQAIGGKAIFTGRKGASGSYPSNGSVYPNTGTMVFLPEEPNAYYGYKPYTYPHPLQNINP